MSHTRAHHGRARQRTDRADHLEYERKGALCHLAAWDARQARLFDRCAAKDAIEPFDALVEQFMSQHPYKQAQRVFLIIDNGSPHRGQRWKFTRVEDPLDPHTSWEGWARGGRAHGLVALPAGARVP
ncbi:MAG: hypothetical protein ACR2LV_01995 [Solirubrobacteraceae bacterium]